MYILSPILFIFLVLNAYLKIEAVNKYTQTEAYLRAWFKIPAEKSLSKQDLAYYSNEMMKKYGTDEQKRDLFLPLIMTMLDNEQRNHTMYVFYHAYNRYAFSYFFDILGEVYNFLVSGGSNTNEPLLRDLIRMQEEWNSIFPYKNAEEFLKSDLKPSNTNTDKRSPLMDFLLSVNLSIFANFGAGFGHHLYSSYAYFDYSRSLGGSGKREEFFNYWGFDNKYHEEISRLYDKITDDSIRSGEMLQIFIPENLIDTLVYASEPLGIPYDRKISNTFDINLNRHLDMLSILQLYRNNPYIIPNHIINTVQGRILLIQSFFAPQNGIKIFSYSLTPKSKEYYQQVRVIIKKMLIDWLKTPKSKELIQKFNLNRNMIYERLGLKYYDDNVITLSHDLTMLHALI